MNILQHVCMFCVLWRISLFSGICLKMVWVQLVPLGPKYSLGCTSKAIASHSSQLWPLQPYVRPLYLHSIVLPSASKEGWRLWPCDAWNIFLLWRGEWLLWYCIANFVNLLRFVNSLISHTTNLYCVTKCKWICLLLLLFALWTFYLCQF